MIAAVLAGGENRRMPFRKGLLELGGRSIIDSTLCTLEGLFDRVLISTNEPEHYFRFGAPMVGDLLPERGPMTGIYSVLMAERGSADGIFVVACDMPFIKPELVRCLIAKGTAHKDAVVPVMGGKPQPLCAVYSGRLAERMLQSIREGRRGLRDFLQGRVDVQYVDEAEVRAHDPEGRSFMNINTLNDLEDVLKAEA